MTEGEDQNEQKQQNGQEFTELERCIVRQVEYYFGDINLPRDKFLKEQILLDDGWIPYTTMLKFKRLAALSSEPSAITAALAKSENRIVQVSEDGAKIRRNPDLPAPELDDERKKELMERTIYAKGLPKEGTALDDCLKFFQKYDDPENLIMRRYSDRATKEQKFKGSVFVTFKTKEQAENFLKQPSVKYGDEELIRKWQSKYLEEKKLENEERYNKAVKKENAKKQQKQEEKIVLPKGTVLILDPIPENMDRNNIKEAITALEGEVGFIQIEEGKAWVRLQKEGTAKTVFEKMEEGKLTVNGTSLTCKIPDAEAEDKFLCEMAEDLMKRKQKFGKHNGGNKNRKRKGPRDGGPHSKRKA